MMDMEVISPRASVKPRALPYLVTTPVAKTTSFEAGYQRLSHGFHGNILFHHVSSFFI